MSNNDGRGRAPKISLDLSNSVNHPNNSIDHNMLFPSVTNNAIYSRRSLSRVTSRGTNNQLNRSRSRSRRSNTNNTIDTDNSDYETISNVSNRTSESRSIHESTLKSDLKYSILNKNPYTERIKIIHSDVDSDYDSDDSDHSYDSYDDNFSDLILNHEEVPELSKKKNKKTEHALQYSSDEEKILDANDDMFKNQLKYNFTDLVMPNTDIPFKDVLEQCKEWINKYKAEYNNQLEPELLESIDHKTFCNNTCEKLTLVLGDEHSEQPSIFHKTVEADELPKTYILQTDGSLETIAYTITSLLKPKDQLYIVCHFEQSSLVKLTQSLISTAQKVLSVFDHVNTSIDLKDVLVNITILKHHYPKHFLSGLIHAVRPVLLIVNMTIIKGWLNGFVCGVPLLVFKRESRTSSFRM